MARTIQRGLSRADEFRDEGVLAARRAEGFLGRLGRYAQSADSTFWLIGMWLGATAIFSLIIPIPGAGEITFLITLAFYIRHYSKWHYRRRNWVMPFRVPSYLKSKFKKVYKDDTTGKVGAAHFYQGHSIDGKYHELNNAEVWSSLDDHKTHGIVVGTTGSGKTELLMGYVFNALCVGSGCIYVDGKADAKSFDSFFRIARLFGREEDLLVLNYIRGGKSTYGGRESKTSNTYNPLGQGSAPNRAEVFKVLMPSRGSGGGGSDTWGQRALAYIDGVTQPLTYLADMGQMLFNANLFAQYLNLVNIENLVHFGCFLDANRRFVWLEDEYGDPNVVQERREMWAYLDANALFALRQILTALPSYSECTPRRPKMPLVVGAALSDIERAEAQKVLDRYDEYLYYRDVVYKDNPQDIRSRPRVLDDRTRSRVKEHIKTLTSDSDSGAKARQNVSEQFGYIVMQITASAQTLANQYGDIYNIETGEVNFLDIYRNRRLFLGLLPALETNSETLQTLGKLIVSALKTALSSGLAQTIEGSRAEIIEGRPSNAVVPFWAVLDEYGYYVVNGFAVVAAQARSYGLSLQVGVQDIDGLMKADPNEGEATWANTNLRLAGRTNAGTGSKTWQYIANVADEAQTLLSQGAELGEGGMFTNVRYNTTLTAASRKRLSYDDLAQQENGEFHMIVGAKTNVGATSGPARGQALVVRFLALYTGTVPIVPRLRVNHYVQFKSPSEIERHYIARNELIARWSAQKSRAEIFYRMKQALDVATPADAAEDPIAIAFRLLAEQDGALLHGSAEDIDYSKLVDDIEAELVALREQKENRKTATGQQSLEKILREIDVCYEQWSGDTIMDRFCGVLRGGAAIALDSWRVASDMPEALA